MSKAIYKIHGMSCDSCAKMLELDLEDAGHKSICSYKDETLEVETKHRLEDLMEIVKKAGYTLSTIK